jgi:hypothetical protein
MMLERNHGTLNFVKNYLSLNHATAGKLAAESR